MLALSIVFIALEPPRVVIAISIAITPITIAVRRRNVSSLTPWWGWWWASEIFSATSLASTRIGLGPC